MECHITNYHKVTCVDIHNLLVYLRGVLDESLEGHIGYLFFGTLHT